MSELTIDEIAEIKKLVEKQKKASIKWVSTISGVSEERIFENASKLGLFVEGEAISISRFQSEHGVTIIYDDADIIPTEQSIDEITIQNLESNGYTFGIESELEQRKKVFRPGIRGAIRFCRFDILLIIYAVFAIAGMILFIVGLTEISSYIIFGVSGFVLIIITVGFSIVLSNVLMIIDDELITKQLLKKVTLDIKSIIHITVKSQQRPRNIFRRKVHLEYDKLIFKTDEKNYSFSLKHFNYNKSDEIKKTIIDTLRIISGNNMLKIHYED
ncbi:MAG: hypothetical protein ACTSPM_04530 [Candidatus Heimdallarchaeota archaeon]